MKTIVLTFAAMAVAFAQAPVAPEKAAAPAKTEVKKHVKKHARKAEAGKPTAAAAAPPAK